LIYLRLLFSAPHLDHEPIYGIDSDDEIHAFWKKCIRDKIISKYNGLGRKEKHDETVLRAKVMLLKYQLLRVYEERTGLRLKSTTKERIFTNDVSDITINDVDVINYDGLEVKNVNLWDKYKDFFTSSGSTIMDEIQKDMQYSLIKTPEYCNGLSTLMCTDVYRSKYPFSAGYTLLGRHNNLVSKKELARRLDYIMSWDYVGDENAKVKLQSLECININVRPYGETPDSQLSAHFPVVAEFAIK